MRCLGFAGQRIGAHRCVLRLRSGYMDAMLGEHFREGQSSGEEVRVHVHVTLDYRYLFSVVNIPVCVIFQINLVDVNIAAFTVFLEYLYTDNLSHDCKNVSEVLQIADQVSKTTLKCVAIYFFKYRKSETNLYYFFFQVQHVHVHACCGWFLYVHVP